jgi:hydroxypyruvate isomerase
MKITRKQAIKNIGVSALSIAALPSLASGSKENNPVSLKGNINHSVCQWCYSSIPLEELVVAAKGMGIKSIDLLRSNEWSVAIKHGLTCAMGYASKVGLNKGFNDPSLHESFLKEYSTEIPKAAEAGLKNVICFSGNANGLSSEQGLENCARGLEPVMKVAAKYNITVCMELLNSKVDHKDYIAHYHTGGVPGRPEIDTTQELYYPAIMRAIVETGFKGYVAQEFIPSAPVKLDSLRKSIEICDV